MREFLKGLDFDEDTIDAIMAEHGKTVSKIKEELDTTKDKLKDLNDIVDKYEKVDIKDLKDKLKEAELKNDKALNAFKKETAIKLELIGKVHNPEVAMSLLKQDEIVMDGDKVKSGLKEQIEGLKKTDSYMFIPETDNSVNQGNNNSVVVKGANPKEGDSVPQGNLSKAELMAKDLAKNANENIKKTTDSIYFGE